MSLRPLAAVVLFLFLAARASHADTYISNGTGGDLLTNAQIVSSVQGQALTAITGSLPLINGTSGGNLFEIYISQPTQFSASTTNLSGGENAFDTQLFLFDSSGLGIEANDDDPNTGQEQSLLPSGSSYLANASAGDYYLLIEGSSRYPADSSGQLIFPNFTDGETQSDALVGPTGPGGDSPLAAFTGNSNQGGNYSIALTGAEFIAVPEPSAMLLLALATAPMLFLRARRPLIG